jgi:hypothetical protein
MGFGNIWLNQRNLDGKRFIAEYYNRCKDCDLQMWHDHLNSFGPLRLYRKCKDELKFEPYLSLPLPTKVRSMFTRLRGGLTRIEANLGRWSIPFKVYTDRKCPLCNLNEVEDESHVLFICPVWKCYRAQLRQYSCFINSNIVELCTTRNSKLIIDICRFLELVTFERAEMLEAL